MKFEYTSTTTVDDAIEHVLMRLNTDFADGCLQVPDFCSQGERDYDFRTEIRVRNKMYQHGVAERCNGKGQPETAIALTAKGADVYDSGGWKKYLLEHEAEKLAKQERENRLPFSVVNHTITNIGDGNVNNTGSHAHIQASISFKKGNAESLSGRLTRLGISQTDVAPLLEALQVEKADDTTGLFGPKVNEWIGRMLGKALDGSWQIGVATAGGVLTEIIKAYYGLGK